MLIQSQNASPAYFGPLNHRQRVFGTARALLLRWRDSPNLLCEIAMFGAPPKFCLQQSTAEGNFIRMMRHFELAHEGEAHPGDVPALNAQLSDRDLGEIFEAIQLFVKEMEKRGAEFRRRRGDKISLADLKALAMDRQ